ncbi:MAG TPA: diadenosine tetraphosphate hydrolase [Mycobacteriales bacterium]
MTAWQTDRVGSALRGENPMVLTRLRAGFAVLGDTQFLPGYCVLLTDTPGADHLTDLPRDRRAEYLTDVGLLGEAVARVCGRRDPEYRRLNYEILGNSLPVLHTHVFPRYGWESPELAAGPVWAYPADHWRHPVYAAGPEHDALRADLTAALREITAEAYS